MLKVPSLLVSAIQISIKAGCAYFPEDFQPKVFLLTFLMEIQKEKENFFFKSYIVYISQGARNKFHFIRPNILLNYF